MGGLEAVLVASGVVREPSEPRPGALWAPGTAMPTRGPGPGARPRQSRIYVYVRERADVHNSSCICVLPGARPLTDRLGHDTQGGLIQERLPAHAVPAALRPNLQRMRGEEGEEGLEEEVTGGRGR